MNDEIPTLFKKHDALSQRVSTLETRTAVQEDRLLSIASAQEKTSQQIAEWRGESAEVHRSLVTEVRRLGETVLLLSAKDSTKGAIIDRWGPLLLAFAAVGVAIWKG